MSLKGLVELIGHSGEFKSVITRAAKGEKQLVLGLTGSQKSLLTAAMVNKNNITMFISYNQYQAEVMAQDLHSLLPERLINVFTPYELFPHEEVTVDWELRKNRLEVLHNIRVPGTIICTSIQALSEALINPKMFYEQTIVIDLDSRIKLDKLSASLVALGYERVDMIESYGHFSIRGGIIDIFPYTRNNPVRIELFDDEVDSIRIFDVANQLSMEKIDKVQVFPGRERLYIDFDGEQVRDKIWAEALSQSDKLVKADKAQEADTLLANSAKHLELLENVNYFPGIDQYLPFLTSTHTLLDYLPENSYILVNEPARVEEYAKLHLQDVSETLFGLLDKGRVLPKVADFYADWTKLWKKISNFNSLVFLSTLDKKISGMEKLQIQEISVKLPQHFHAQLDTLVDQIKLFRKSQYRILLIVSTKERGKRLVEFLKSNDIPAQYWEDTKERLKYGNCIVTKGSLETGLEYPGAKLAVYTDYEIYGKKRARRRFTSKEKHLALTERDLSTGDYVVHINHGIGQYLGVETLEVQNIHKDYLLIKFAGKDRLYVPTDQIELLQRYVGINDLAPKLSKLGGVEWSKVKKRVKESVQELAEGLIDLYAVREATEGFAYPEDTPWQQEFEDAFPYEETQDQIRAIEEVKRDMERSKPMDRLLCGDVGYGKTEVAIRAAFKAVGTGKQVAVLVPTTILAQQHNRTFAERFQDYPVTIGVLSRFQSPAQQKKIVQGLKTGIVDIVIGTHRLLSKDVKYHNLGLVVVDEEQRFGVVQKERLKEICQNVDVLTLSATPIPRTLHMAMVGVRDMSLIETPPEDRFPIRTYVMEWNDETITQAITRELGRQGQVYFVYNRVQGIESMYRRIKNLIPEAKIALAHGQMDENRLEQVMLDFYQGEYDILLCTTIIETGMDISNVNTLIIYDADYLGLAQLYQLRGRVGRSSRVAYAYFTYRKDKILTEDAEKRLQAIKEFSELGSGIKIAMRDLEIRGAGNILGPEQHGFITSVGFELYCKLLDEAIKKIKGQVVQKIPEPVLDLNVDAYIGDRYISDPKQKVEFYKKMAAVKSLEDATELEMEFEDRFGDLPDSVRNLLLVTQIKVLAREIGIASITSQKGIYMIRLLSGIIGNREKYHDLIRTYAGRVGYTHTRNPLVKIKVHQLTDFAALTLLKQVLEAMK